jgi:serine/threonine protein kinase
VHQCLRIGLDLASAVDFLHRLGLTHRDIKPRNIIFVNSRPKLADLGLVTEIRLPDEQQTVVGTLGYMPPPPEIPGTPQADVYALGMVLYVISTGRAPAFFPEFSTTLAGKIKPEEFYILHTIILKACMPDPALRFGSAAEMLQEVKRSLENGNKTTESLHR